MSKINDKNNISTIRSSLHKTEGKKEKLNRLIFIVLTFSQIALLVFEKMRRVS